MKFRIASDLHLEQHDHTLAKYFIYLPVMEDEKNTVLLLAGDIGVAKYPESYMFFMKEMSERFRYVVHIAGNHEFYGGSFITTRLLINESYRERGISDNVAMVEREVLEFEDVRIIAATLWTDMDNLNPISMMDCSRYMSDYRRIKTGKLTGDYFDSVKYQLVPEDTIEDFIKSRDFIFEELQIAKSENKKAVVMTHHAPSRKSISDYFKDSNINGGFVSELSEEILDLDYDMVWVHGHVHSNHNYNLGKCNVICNPYGYQNENNFFEPECVIEL